MCFHAHLRGRTLGSTHTATAHTVKKKTSLGNSNHQTLSRARRRWFFVITITFPLCFFVLAEVLLRLMHYGPDLSLFTTEVIAGKTYHIMNPSVKARYFSRVEFSPNTSPDFFSVPKRPGTFRIFCLGGSTTVGFPYGFVGSFSTFLRDRLKQLFPDRSIEVINLGMTATNSYTVLDIARELVDYEPDLFCVYDGHNEFYGALGIASREAVASSRWVTKLYLRLVHFRTFLLLRDAYSFLGKHNQESGSSYPAGTMMERLARGQYIRCGSEEYATALENFRANMSELRSICSEHHIYLLLASQVSNLRDRPPFVSQDPDQWTPAQRLQFHLKFNQGIAFRLNGLPDSALQRCDRLLADDSLRADLHFERACSLDSLKRRQEARVEYEKARDCDMLRFRASSDFNNAIRSMEDGEHTFFVDVERKFRSNSPDSLIGNNLILEHLHPNARGYFLIAKEFTWPMHLHQIIADEKTWNERDHLDDEQLWSERPLTELDLLCALRRTLLLTSGWPFRPDTREVPSPPAEDTVGTIVSEMVEGRITWEQGHVAAAMLFEKQHQGEKAEREYKALMNQIPLNVSAYLLLGRLYLKEGKNREAAAVLFASTSVEQTQFANRALGMLALRPKDAIPFLEKALALSVSTEERKESGFLLADAYNRDGDPSRATRQLEEVLRWAPDFVPAQRLLQNIAGTRP